MISALCWIRRGVASQNPKKYDIDEKEYERIQALAAEELARAQGELDEAQEESGSQEEDTEKEAAVDPELAEYDLENYDAPAPEEEEGEEQDVSIFGKVKGLTYYNSNKEDPYITINDDEDSEKEELEILASDNLLLAAKTEDDISHMEVYVYEEEEDNLYVHHDIMLPSFPLCLEWLDFKVGKQAGEGSGNFVAVGTFDPDIEIWDLDTVDSMYPDLILGNPDKKTKRGKKAKKINANYHTDAVMSLSWNKNHRNMLASSSADTTVKIWDLASASCVRSFEHHKDKVQSVLWHPVESTVMLTGGYDKVIAAFDSRSPENISTWSIDSDVECIKWDPFQPQQFYVSTEAGTVLCFDVRNPNSAPIFTLHAHDSPVSAMDVNLVVPGLLVTGSTDKIVKVWDIKENKPSMVTSRNLDVGKIFNASFCPDSAFQLGVAGSKGEVHIWDLATNPGIRRSFEGRGIAPGAAAVEIEEKPTLTLPADDSESEDDEEMEAEADEDDDESMDI